MISIRETDRQLSIAYRPTMVGILGGIVVVLGLVALAAGLLKPRRVAVRCEGERCVVEKIAVLRTTSVDVANLRGGWVEEKRRGARDNVRLVVRGDRDVEMGPWASRGDRNAYAYRDIAAKIDAYVAAGKQGRLEASVTLSRTIVLWMIAALLLGLGGILIGIYATGSKVTVDGARGEYRHGKQRGALSELASVEVRGPAIVAKRRDGREVRLLKTIARKGKASPQLGVAAERIRAYIG